MFRHVYYRSHYRSLYPMGRSVRDHRLETRSARLRLALRSEPYWRGIENGAHLGYRRGARGGVWVARLRPEGKSSGYFKTTLGQADDTSDADGVRIFDYRQAQTAARAWFSTKARQFGDFGVGGPYTVEQAMSDYLTWFRSHRKSVADTERVSAAFIVPKLGKRQLAKLTAREIREWHRDLAEEGARIRTKPGKKQRYRDGSADPEAARRRRSTANRVLTVFKAALNHAWREGRAVTDEPWRRVRPFHNVEAVRVRYLTDDEARRLVGACNAEFRPLVQAALLTGARYGELAALRVADFNADGATIHVRESKGGKDRHIALTDEGLSFFSQVAAGRSGNEVMLAREDGRSWGRNHQQRPLSDACAAAKVAPAATFHHLRHTYASRLAMRRVPLHVIAEQLGHADTRVTQRHYAHLAPSYVGDVIRAASPALGIVSMQMSEPLIGRHRSVGGKHAV